MSITKTLEVTIPFLDLKAQFATLEDDVCSALLDVARSGQYVLGPHVEAFEEAFAEYIGARHCVALNSGTSALHLALLAAGVGPGDEVLTVPMTFIATSWAISYIGATPVFVDVDPDTYTMDPQKAASRITPRVKAILPVHLYGQPADLRLLMQLSERHGIPLIEDAAQAHGARYAGKRVGNMGLCGCFSFYPGKNLGAYGEGGAVITDDHQIAERMRRLRDHAQSRRYHHEEIGFNYRMDAFQGAILGVKLRYLEEWTKARRNLAARYRDRLQGLPLTLPQEAIDRQSVWHLYVTLVANREEARRGLEARGVQTGLHYPIPLHMQKAYQHLGYHEGDFPITERIARECLSLPMFPEMTFEQQDAVCEALAEVLQETNS
jgi:dTDP-4-amino-4,6-dideoxygalactose transaminase